MAPDPDPGPRVRSAVSSPASGIDLAALQLAVRERSAELLRCYEDRVGPPRSATAVPVELTFDANGHVARTDVGAPDAIAPCLTRVLGAIVVPPPDGDRPSVTLRITYEPS